MQSWEAKVVLRAEQNYASDSFSSELIKRFQQLLANLSIIIGSALVEEKRQLNHSSNWTGRRLYKTYCDSCLSSTHARTRTHTHITNRNYKAETRRREKVRERLSERI